MKAHSILSVALLLLIGCMTMGASGCDKIMNTIDPPKSEVYYPVAFFNTDQWDYEMRIANPDSSHQEYTNWRRFDALSGVQSYWLRERPYEIQFRKAVTKELVRDVSVEPNGIADDAPYNGMPGLGAWYEYRTNHWQA